MEIPHLLNIETHSPHKTYRPTCITLFTTIIQIQTQHKKLCSLLVLQLSASHELRREGDRERELEGGIPSFCMYAFSYPDPPSTLKTHKKKSQTRESGAYIHSNHTCFVCLQIISPTHPPFDLSLSHHFWQRTQNNDAWKDKQKAEGTKGWEREGE